MGGDVGGSSDAKSEPNVVPLCDILLVLLIIFMVITPLLKKGVNVQLPEAANTIDEPEPGKMLTVSIKSDGTVWLNDKLVENLQTLATHIEDLLEETEQEEKTKLLLKADPNTTYEKVVLVMDEIRKAQIEVIGLITDPITTGQ